VIDGDTLEVAGHKIRLHGIDAPEPRQSCQRQGAVWLCGKEASLAMRELVRDAIVQCEALERDRYGRIIGRCKSNGMDVSESLVSMGLALAYRKYSEDYVLEEEKARSANRGVWSGDFIPPWDWRRGGRLEQKAANDNQPCLIKGNISRSGERIYHVPGGQYYGRTKISSEKGERYFCSEAEAVAAGWRRSKR
jgi:endonuclease YncB( thermonuclease family)